MFPIAELSELVIAEELVRLIHRAFGGPPTKPSTIRQWIKRGIIPSTDKKDQQGRSLYSRKDVIEALEQRHAAAD
jgi:DNA-binding transcriptional MerR regulator